MKKHAIILAVLASVSAVSITGAWKRWVSVNDVPDKTRIEDAIIIRDIEMESDIPPAESEEMADGSIIHDDSFFEGEDLGKEEKKKEPTGREILAKMQKKDPRWHVVPYKIKKNDNLWKLSKRYGVGHRIIIGLNEINDPDMLSPGKSIKVPSRKGVYHVVKKGDSISMMAKRYKVNAKTIMAHNHIRGGAIKMNRKIFIPEAEERRELKRPDDDSPAEKKESIASLKTRFVWPVVGKITSGFGNRRDPFSGRPSFHCGIDIGAENGSKIRSAAAGRVIFSGWKDRYGNLIVIRHDGGYITVYAHNSNNIVKEGDVVPRGAIIGYSGNTGAVTGPHLHFEIRKGVGYPLNPLRMIR